MSVKNKKKNSVLEPKNLVITSIAAVFVILLAVAMSLMLPKDDKKNSFDNSAWQSAVRESERKTEPIDADDAMTSVYSESAVAAANEAVPEEDNSEAGDSGGESEARDESQNPSSGITINAIRLAPPVTGMVTVDYSADELVYSETMHDWRTHNGIDYATPEGTDVFAAAAGTVEAITDNSMFGTTVVILHDGGLRTIYSNLSDVGQTAVGDVVAQGAIIGKTGSSAAAEAAQTPHLHFEVSFNEETVNPHDYLPEAEETE